MRFTRKVGGIPPIDVVVRSYSRDLPGGGLYIQLVSRITVDSLAVSAVEVSVDADNEQENILLTREEVEAMRIYPSLTLTGINFQRWRDWAESSSALDLWNWVQAQRSYARPARVKWLA